MLYALQGWVIPIYSQIFGCTTMCAVMVAGGKSRRSFLNFLQVKYLIFLMGVPDEASILYHWSYKGFVAHTFYLLGAGGDIST